MAWQPDYVTLAQLKAFMRIEDTIDDAELALAITAASRAVDDATDRQFGRHAAPVAMTYPARWSKSRCSWYVTIDDLFGDPTAVTDTELVDLLPDVTGYTPSNANALGWPRKTLLLDKRPATDDVIVTAQFGWLAVPGAVQQATLLQASRFSNRRDSPMGVAGSPEMGSELRLLARVDPDVAVSLARYSRRKPVLG